MWKGEGRRVGGEKNSEWTISYPSLVVSFFNRGFLFSLLIISGWSEIPQAIYPRDSIVYPEVIYYGRYQRRS